MSMLPIDLAEAERGLSAALVEMEHVPLLGPYLTPGKGMITLPCGGAGKYLWPIHVHVEHQFFWGARGPAIVLTPAQYWLLPPGTGLWLPAGTPHALYIGQETRVNCTMVALDLQTDWNSVRSLAMPPAACELLQLHAFSAISDTLRTRIEHMVLDLIALETKPNIHLPMPTDARLMRVVQGILADLADERPLLAWCAIAAMSERNFTRRFRAETGLSFRDWRTLARMRLAVTLLAEGQSLPRIAAQTGYGTASAFVSAFHRVVGHTPGSYGASGKLAG